MVMGPVKETFGGRWRTKVLQAYSASATTWRERPAGSQRANRWTNSAAISVRLRYCPSGKQGEGQAPIGIPGERQPDRGNHPVVAEGEEALAVLRTPLSVGRGMGVVVHGRAEQVGAALVTERVVQDQRGSRDSRRWSSPSPRASIAQLPCDRKR